MDIYLFVRLATKGVEDLEDGLMNPHEFLMYYKNLQKLYLEEKANAAFKNQNV